MGISKDNERNELLLWSIVPYNKTQSIVILQSAHNKEIKKLVYFKQDTRSVVVISFMYSSKHRMQDYEMNRPGDSVQLGRKGIAFVTGEVHIYLTKPWIYWIEKDILFKVGIKMEANAKAHADPLTIKTLSLLTWFVESLWLFLSWLSSSRKMTWACKWIHEYNDHHHEDGSDKRLHMFLISICYR